MSSQRDLPTALKSSGRKLRAAVIGVGYLGNFHAQKYAACPQVELIGVVDTDKQRAAEVAAKYGTAASNDYRSLFGEADLVSIVVPPARHFQIARDCLESGIHALVEKPLTERVDHAEELIRCAARNQRILQVGHLERFNPVFLALTRHLRRPGFIETRRFSAYNRRGTEVDVVLDLMIHDIDIVLHIAQSPIKALQCSGTAVVTDDIDIANARIEFASGLVAQLAASRVSKDPTRDMKVIQGEQFIEVDYLSHELRFGVMKDGHEQTDGSELTFERESPGNTDVLRDEILAFVAAVRQGSAPLVSGEDGKRALELAVAISRRIHRHGQVEIDRED